MSDFLQLPPNVAAYVNTGAPSASLGKDGDFYTNSATTELYQKISGTWSLVSGGGGSGVSSVNGYTGAVTLAKADIGLANVDNTADANKPVSTAQAAADAAVQAYAIQRANHTGTQDISTVNSGGNFNQLLQLDGTGVVVAVSNYGINSNGGLNAVATVEPNDLGGQQFELLSLNIEPLQDSPNETWNIRQLQVQSDPTDTGFNIADTGTAIRLYNNSIAHLASGDIGEVNFFSNYFNIGNGTDPINARGMSYMYGFGEFNSGVTITGPLQGYGFQPVADAGAAFGPSSYVNVFYDFPTFNVEVPSYTSFAAAPTIAEQRNNSGYTGLNINPTINQFNGNSGVTGIGIAGTYAAFGTGGFTGLNVNPAVAQTKYAAGINVDMSNVTPYPGAVSELTIQDIEYVWNSPGDNDAYSIEYVDDVTAGSEYVTIAGQSITIHMESGVSTATQVKAAWDANLSAVGAATATIIGVASNPQVAAAAANFTGGENVGNVKAAIFTGNVQITGSLSFSGGLSIGTLNAYGNYPIVNGTGSPTSTHMLITAPTLAANQTRTMADYIGVNTAMLVDIGDNSTVTTAFLGMAALGLPAVAKIGASASVDRMSGATFAVSLDPGGGAGGSIDTLDLCRALALPNGVTAINKLRGFTMDLPFGDPGTTTHGVYISPAVNNYFAGMMKIGGGSDVVTNSSVLVEFESTTKAVRLPRMTTTQRDAMTPLDGMLIFNTTTSTLQYYDGSAWV